MPKFNKLIFVIILTIILSLVLFTNTFAQTVKVEGRQLLVKERGVYEPFLVKGIGYSITPIGQFMGYGTQAEPWSGICSYEGPVPDPIQTPDIWNRRFEHDWSSYPEVSFECTNGTAFYTDTEILHRDFTVIHDMNANTIRTWAKVTNELLSEANQQHLKVIAGYWVDHNIDYTFPPDGMYDRDELIADFVNYVNTFKNDPAILMWGLSNENNLGFCNPCYNIENCDRQEQAAGYYVLMNDMATAAKAQGVDPNHPVVIVSAELDPLLIQNASLLSNVDIIGINSYRGENFNVYPYPPEPGQPKNLFEQFEAAFPNKPILIPEFGVDAWYSYNSDTPENGYLDETTQANWNVSAWKHIVQNSFFNGGPCIGGAVFVYADAWDGYGKPDAQDACWVSSAFSPSVSTHDYGCVIGMEGSVPDKKCASIEWWGYVSLEENPNGIDIVNPRPVYYRYQDEYNCTDADGDGYYKQGASCFSAADCNDNCYDTDNTCSDCGGPCFIATAAYGSYDDKYVKILRKFRDQHLLKNRFGRKFVELYYKFSPPLADFIADKPALRAGVRAMLKPLVWFSERVTK